MWQNLKFVIHGPGRVRGFFIDPAARSNPPYTSWSGFSADPAWPDRPVPALVVNLVFFYRYYFDATLRNKMTLDLSHIDVEVKFVRYSVRPRKFHFDMKIYFGADFFCADFPGMSDNVLAKHFDCKVSVLF